MQHKRHFLIYLFKESGAVAHFPTVHPLFYTSSRALHTRNDRINITNVRPFALCCGRTSVHPRLRYIIVDSSSLLGGVWSCT